MRLLIVTTVIFFSMSAAALEFKFEVANAFSSSKQMQEKLNKQIDKINKAYLQPLKMRAQITSVTKSFSIHTVKGTLIGEGCVPSDELYQKVSYREIGYPVGVDVDTILGIGILWPVGGVYEGTRELHREYFLVHQCL